MFLALIVVKLIHLITEIVHSLYEHSPSFKTRKHALNFSGKINVQTLRSAVSQYYAMKVPCILDLRT